MFTQILVILFRVVLFVSDVIQFIGIVFFFVYNTPLPPLPPSSQDIIRVIAESQVSYPAVWVFVFILTYIVTFPFVNYSMKQQISRGNLNRWRALLWFLFVFAIIPLLFYSILLTKHQLFNGVPNPLFSAALSSLIVVPLSFWLTNKIFPKMILTLDGEGYFGLATVSSIAHYLLSLLLFIGIFTFYQGFLPTIDTFFDLVMYNALGLFLIFAPFTLISIFCSKGGEDD